MELQSAEIKKQWLNASLTLAAVLGLILILFFDTIRILVMTWWDKPEYNHCLLILPIIAYLVHERRDIFKKISPNPTWLGLLPIGAGGMLWLLGEIADTNVVQQFGLIILLQGALLTILGRRVMLALLFPIFYMIFLIPFGDFLVPMLQDFTTSFVVSTLNLLDIPVYVHGVFLSIPAGDFHVAEACAGLRFLIATVALGTLMANVAYKTLGRQIVVIILSFIVPVIANGLRASGIVLIAHWSKMKYATGVDHIVFGWIFFAFVLLVFISIAMTFTNRGLHDGYIDFSKKYWSENINVPMKKFVLFSAIGAISISLFPVYVSVIESRYKAYDNNILTVDNKIWGQNSQETTNWKPQYEGASQSFYLREGQVGPEPIDVFLAFYKYQADNMEMIRYGNGVAQSKVWERVEGRYMPINISGLDRSVNEVVLQSGSNKRLVWFWYWVDGDIVASNYKAKLMDAKAKFLGGRLDSAVIAISVPMNEDDIKKKRETLANFAVNLPSIDAMVHSSSAETK